MKETKLDPESVGLKGCRLDVRAVTACGEHVNVEVQLENQWDMEKRTLFYWSKLYASQLGEGARYRMLAKTITINILNFVYLENQKVHSIYQARELETHALLSDVFEIHFVELPKLWDSNGLDLTCPLTRWLLFLSDDTDQDLMEAIFVKDETIHKAYEDLEKLKADEGTRRMYEIREKALLDWRSNIGAARDEGREEGREEGRKEGISLGEMKERTRMAQKMMEKGLGDDIIREITGLTEEQLRNLKGKESPDC